MFWLNVTIFLLALFTEISLNLDLRRKWPNTNEIPIGLLVFKLTLLVLQLVYAIRILKEVF